MATSLMPSALCLAGPSRRHAKRKPEEFGQLGMICPKDPRCTKSTMCSKYTMRSECTLSFRFLDCLEFLG